jgi:hypothetical protein
MWIVTVPVTCKSAGILLMLQPKTVSVKYGESVNRGIDMLEAGDTTSLAKQWLMYKVLPRAQRSLGVPNRTASAEAS